MNGPGFVTPVDLAYLKAHYGDAYWLTVKNGQYVAHRRDDMSMVRADSAEEMLDLLREDCALRPVSRD